MRARTLVLAVAIVALLVWASACTASPTAREPEQTHDSALSSQETSDDVSVFEEEPMHESPVKLTGTETAVIKTSKGDITLEFYPNDAPNTVASFVELAESGFYDGIKFHRVVPGFVAQGGDPLTRDLTPEQVRQGAPGVGTGGPGWTQKAEFNSRAHEKGTLAMARSRDYDSAGSQFYICLAPQPSLDGQYTVFGRVTAGMDVVESIQVGDVIETITVSR